MPRSAAGSAVSARPSVASVLQLGRQVKSRLSSDDRPGGYLQVGKGGAVSGEDAER